MFQDAGGENMKKAERIHDMLTTSIAVLYEHRWWKARHGLMIDRKRN